jgi:transcription initiation factor TFIIIB Brf1 subunit/transcription initiation factor TFIIB
MKERGRPSIIADQTVYSAINILGGAPSQRKTSQFIGVSEKTLREWRKSKGFKQWGDFISSATGRKSN